MMAFYVVDNATLKAETPQPPGTSPDPIHPSGRSCRLRADVHHVFAELGHQGDPFRAGQSGHCQRHPQRPDGCS